MRLFLYLEFYYEALGFNRCVSRSIMLLLLEQAILPDFHLQANNLSCERGFRQLFTGINLSVQAGDVLRIVGANGAGKSTLLNVLAGTSSDYQGEMLFNQQPLHKMRFEYREQCVFLGHANAVKTSLTVLENLQLFQTLYPCSNNLLADVLAQVQLTGFEHVLAGQLSAGQKQRVALARLLMSSAALWILDEPFTAIDKQGIAHFEQILAAEAKNGRAIILTAHHDVNIDGLQQLELEGDAGV